MQRYPSFLDDDSGHYNEPIFTDLRNIPASQSQHHGLGHKMPGSGAYLDYQSPLQSQLLGNPHFSSHNSLPLGGQESFIRGPEHSMHQQHRPQGGALSYSNYAQESASRVFRPPFIPQNGWTGQPVQQQSSYGMNSNGRQMNITPAFTPPGQRSSEARIVQNPGTGGSNAHGRALNKMLLEILRERAVDPHHLAMAIDTHVESMDFVNLATVLFHTGKKRLLLVSSFIERIAKRFETIKDELRAREASNALYGMRCMNSECLAVRQLVKALAIKLSCSSSHLVAQAVGNALYGLQMMTSDHDEVRYLISVLTPKIADCKELLEAQNVGNALYGLRGMNSDHKEVRLLLEALTPKVATAREELNGQAVGNSLYGLQGMSSREFEVRKLLAVLAGKISQTWEDLKAQEVGNALYGLKRLDSDVPEVRKLIDALIPKVVSSRECLDAQAIGNSLYGLQNMTSEHLEIRALLSVMAQKVSSTSAELDGQAIGNALYGLQGMSSEHHEVRTLIMALFGKIHSSALELNAQEMGNSIYGLQNMTSDYPEVRKLIAAITFKVATSRHDLTSQEIGNALNGLQGMSSDVYEVRKLLSALTVKIERSRALLDPQGVGNALFGLKRMTCDAQEVRHLLLVISDKIEQSWKLMSSQHITNALMGLSGLCSATVEVRRLLRVIAPKIQMSRDEMSIKQLSSCVHSMRNMYSEHEEVQVMITALTDKMVLSRDSFTSAEDIGAFFFGMQGFSSDSVEVIRLVEAATVKIGSGELLNPDTISNALFGMQRMKSDPREVQNLLQIFATKAVALARSASDQSPDQSPFNSMVVGNAIYGMQGLSCTVPAVHTMMRLFTDMLAAIVSTLAGTAVDAADHQGIDPRASFQDVLYIYQTTSLALIANQNLDPEIQSSLITLHSTLKECVERRFKSEHCPLVPTLTQQNLVDAVSTLLRSEPYIVSTSELVCGFETEMLIRLNPLINMTLKGGEAWKPMLNIELNGAGCNCPGVVRFTILRDRYLQEVEGLSVERVFTDEIEGNDAAAIKRFLTEKKSIFIALYPPTLEDASSLHRYLRANPTILTNQQQSNESGNTSQTADALLRQQQANMPGKPKQLMNSNFIMGGSDFHSIDKFDKLMDKSLKQLDLDDKNDICLNHTLRLRFGWTGRAPSTGNSGSRGSRSDRHDRTSASSPENSAYSVGTHSNNSATSELQSASSILMQSATRQNVPMQEPDGSYDLHWNANTLRQSRQGGTLPFVPSQGFGLAGYPDDLKLGGLSLSDVIPSGVLGVAGLTPFTQVQASLFDSGHQIISPNLPHNLSQVLQQPLIPPQIQQTSDRNPSSLTYFDQEKSMHLGSRVSGPSPFGMPMIHGEASSTTSLASRADAKFDTDFSEGFISHNPQSQQGTKNFRPSNILSDSGSNIEQGSQQAAVAEPSALDDQIALMERELEIKKLEAKLMMLRSAKASTSGGGGTVPQSASTPTSFTTTVNLNPSN